MRLRQNYQVFCPACGTAVETNEYSERHCPDCGLWYTDQQLFGYQPRHLTQRAPDVLQAHDMGEVNGVKLTYVNGNVFATPAKRR